MTYVVTDNCIACKYTDCVEVCPVDCFYEGENMLVIHPDECIDCGVCEPECPADAIRQAAAPAARRPKGRSRLGGDARGIRAAASRPDAARLRPAPVEPASARRYLCTAQPAA